MPNTSKLTARAHARIIESVKAGVFLETAAAAAGVSKRSLHRWLRRGRAELGAIDRATEAYSAYADAPEGERDGSEAPPQPPERDVYAMFAADVDEALAQYELRSVLDHERLTRNTITKTEQCGCGRDVTVSVPVPSNVQVHALQWKLERKFPTRYGNRQTLVHETQVQESMESMLDSVRPHMSPGAYDELLDAIEAEMGSAGVAG